VPMVFLLESKKQWKNVTQREQKSKTGRPRD